MSAMLDIDECALGTDDCEHMCTNFMGGYYCSCRSGYKLNADMNTCSGMLVCYTKLIQKNQHQHSTSAFSHFKICCIKTVISDIDECVLSTDDCEHMCTNSIGGYNCSCHSGYTLEGDMKNCTGMYIYIIVLTFLHTL